MKRRSNPGAVVVGLIVLVLGVLFLLETTGVAHQAFANLWPVVLILLGAWLTFQERGRGFAGPIVFLLGLGFLLENLDVISSDWLSRYWPLALVVVGATILLGAIFGKRSSGAPMRSRSNEQDWIDAVAVLSGQNELVRSRSWHGGRATAILGGVELDLRDAQAVPDGAVLHVSSFLGGVDITVPESWEVTLHGTPVLGGFDDKTHHPKGTEASSRLEVVGTTVLGGVDVKN